MHLTKEFPINDPPINEYKCNKCDLSFPSGWGGYKYVEVDKKLLKKRIEEITAEIEKLKKYIKILQTILDVVEGLLIEIACKSQEEIRDRIKDRLRYEFECLEIDVDEFINELLGSRNYKEELKREIRDVFYRVFMIKLKEVVRREDERLKKLENDRRYIEEIMGELKKTGKDYKRIPCSHPREYDLVTIILGEDAPKELIKSRTGFNSYCICLDCLHQFEADLRDEKVNEWRLWYGFPSFKEAFRSPQPPEMKDERKCPKCGSKNVKTVFELVGKTCPKCKEGIIEEIETGEVT